MNANTNNNSAAREAGRKIQITGGIITLVVIVGILSISLSHLSAGLEKLTGDAQWLSRLLAGTIDFGILASESALIIAGLYGLKDVKGWALFNLIITVLLSGTLNSLSFTHYEPTGAIKAALCIFLGWYLPIMGFTLGKMAFGLFVGLTEEAEANKAKARSIVDLSRQEEEEEIASLEQLLEDLAAHKAAGKTQASFAREVVGKDPAYVSRRLKRAEELGLVRR